MWNKIWYYVVILDQQYLNTEMHAKPNSKNVKSHRSWPFELHNELLHQMLSFTNGSKCIQAYNIAFCECVCLCPAALL